MPIYEFQCLACCHTQESFQGLNDPPPDVCDNCKQTKTLQKQISQTAFHLKGGGWYKDLYASQKPCGSSESCQKENKTCKAQSSEPST